MNWLDILIALIITIPAFFGFRKGFVRKLMGIAGIIVGFILAVKFYNPIASLLSNIITENSVFVSVLSFLIIIAIVYAASVWLARFIANLNSGVSMLDKIFGSITGFLQGLIIASVLCYNLSIADIPSKKTQDSSLFYNRVIHIAPIIFNKIISYFPGLKTIYNDYINLNSNKAN
jgi:membrane protein required for colicin V production